ncbi:MAG: hypothetical protein JWQ41_212 [Variovorax sp.]|nr:hypothetical protein [Variovorax sp.]
MPWLKLFHVSAVILWAGALLYLPLAIAASSGRRAADSPAALDVEGSADAPERRTLRGLFVGVATPFALLAIGSGTALFLLYGPLAHWLIVKLGFVSLLVLGHAACGMLVLRVERQEAKAGTAFAGYAVAVVSLTWMAAIAWLALQKPFF